MLSRQESGAIPLWWARVIESRVVCIIDICDGGEREQAPDFRVLSGFPVFHMCLD